MDNFNDYNADDLKISVLSTETMAYLVVAEQQRAHDADNTQHSLLEGQHDEHLGPGEALVTVVPAQADSQASLIAFLGNDNAL